MRRDDFLRLGLAACAAAVLAGCATPGEPAGPALQRAAQATGADRVRTLAYTASGTGATFGQAYQPADPWPRITLPRFARVLDYDNAAMREDSVRVRAEPNGGGALPLMGQGEQRTTGFVRGTNAWNLAGTAASAAPVALDQRIHDLWTTPHGVIKAAMKNGATARRDGSSTIVSFAEPGRFRANAWIGASGLVERVESTVPSPVLGDTPVVTTYSEWRDFNGVKFPMRIRQDQGGHPVYDLQVQEVTVNAPAAIDLPANVPTFAERAAPEKVADGVWFLGGGSHNSVLVEMRDHAILIESPLYDGRTQAVFAEAKALLPAKPVRYVINSHHHFDHSGGLRTAAAEGATLVVSQQALPWYQRVFATPNSVRPDALARSGRRPVLEGVGAMRSFTDGQRTVEVRYIEGSPHAQGFMLVWLPRERLLVEADAFTPGAPNTPPPATPNANNVNLADNIERLKLDVDRILPLHGRVVPVSELYTAIGRKR